MRSALLAAAADEDRPRLGPGQETRRQRRRRRRPPQRDLDRIHDREHGSGFAVAEQDRALDGRQVPRLRIAREIAVELERDIKPVEPQAGALGMEGAARALDRHRRRRLRPALGRGPEAGLDRAQPVARGHYRRNVRARQQERFGRAPPCEGGGHAGARALG